jgi:hypothetical protein
MKEQRSWLYVIVMILSGLVGGALSGHFWPPEHEALAATRAGTIRAQNFVLVDQTGNQRGVMQVTRDGKTRLAFNDARSEDRVELLTATDGSTGLRFYDRDGKKLLALGEAPDGRAGLAIFGSNGTMIAGFGLSAPDETSLTLFDHNTGRARVGIGVAKGGEPALVLLDQSGTERAELSLRTDGTAGLAIVDQQGKKVASLP